MINVQNGDLHSAIESAAVGETIVLTGNVVLTARSTVNSVVIIDLNGYTITGDINDGYGAVYVGTKGDLTIIDSSLTKTGSIINNVGNAIGNYGMVTINAGTFVGKYALYNFFYNNDVYGKSEIHGGTFKSAVADSPAIANCGELTINNGSIESIDTTNTLTVNGGTISSLYIGKADYNPEKQSTSITGGHVTDLEMHEDTINDISISGGTFKTEIDPEYLSEGFELSYDEGTGQYGAISNGENSESGLKVIATSSSRIRDLVIKNNQLIFIQDLKRIAFDFNNKRVFYNQITELSTDDERMELDSPLSGYYFVIDTAVLWFYKNEWIPITKQPEEVIFIGVELPELGTRNKLYIDTDDREISVWDEDSQQYIAVSNYTEEVTIEDIDDLFE